MNTDWWRKVEEAYHTARELSGDERSRFLEAAAASDAAMRRQIEVLLRQEDNSDSLLNTPAVKPLLVDRAPELAAGIQLGAYRIEAPLAEGGMGVVYRARDTRLNRPVAIKFLSEDLADAGARRRFQREAQMASSLNHPHILTVHDAGEWEGRQYLVTESCRRSSTHRPADRCSSGSARSKEVAAGGITAPLGMGRAAAGAADCGCRLLVGLGGVARAGEHGAAPSRSAHHATRRGSLSVVFPRRQLRGIYMERAKAG